MQIQNLVESIQKEQREIEANQQERNMMYRTCLGNFRNHLVEEISSIEDCMKGSDKRNAVFMDDYEATYERILTGAEQIIRRMKRTYFEKKKFCQSIIENHGEAGREEKQILNDQMAENEANYYEAIQNQKMPKVNFHKYMAEKEVSKRLEEEKDKNRVLEEKLTMQGTAFGKFTLKNTHTDGYMTRKQDRQIDPRGGDNHVLNRFMKQTAKNPNNFDSSRRSSHDRIPPFPPSPYLRSYDSPSPHPNDILNKFTRKQ